MARRPNTTARLDVDLIAAIEAQRLKELQPPSFAHMVRQLLREALVAREKPAPRWSGVDVGTGDYTAWTCDCGAQNSVSAPDPIVCHACGWAPNFRKGS